MVGACLEFFKKKYGIDIAERVTDIFVDAHAGCRVCCETFFPGAKIHLYLKHAQTNIEKVKGDSKKVCPVVEATAFMPNKFLFHKIWESMYEELAGVDVEGDHVQP